MGFGRRPDFLVSMQEIQRAEDAKANMVGLGALACALAHFVRIGEKMEVECTISWPLRLILKLVVWSSITVRMKAMILASLGPRREQDLKRQAMGAEESGFK